MTYTLGPLQLRILAVMRTAPERVWVYDVLAVEVYGGETKPIERQALTNAMRALGRRNLVVLDPPSRNEWGIPDQRPRARLAA